MTGKSSGETKGRATISALPFSAGLVAAYILAVIIDGLGITIRRQGILIGAALWIGVSSTAPLTTGKPDSTPRGAWLLFALHQLVVYSPEGLTFVPWTR